MQILKRLAAAASLDELNELLKVDKETCWEFVSKEALARLRQMEMKIPAPSEVLCDHYMTQMVVDEYAEPFEAFEMDDGYYTVCRMDHAHILYDTVQGQVIQYSKPVQSFTISDVCTLAFKRTDDSYLPRPLVKGSLDCNNGMMLLKWASKPQTEEFSIKLSYEYNGSYQYEC